jgi:hypothetical protein
VEDPAGKLRALNEDTFKAEAKHEVGGMAWDRYLQLVLTDDFRLRRSRADVPDETRAAMIDRIARASRPVDREIVPGSVEVWHAAGLGVIVSVVIVPDEAGNPQAYQNIKVCTATADAGWRCTYWQVTARPLQA